MPRLLCFTLKSTHTCMLCFCLISAICITAGVIIGWELRVRNFSGVDINSTNSSISRTVFLQAELVSVDPIASNVVMNWYLDDDSCEMKESPDPCTPVAIYFNTNLLRLNGDDSDKNLSNEVAEVPIFTWHPDEDNNSPLSNVPWFRTTLALFTNGNSPQDDPTLQNYPFDSYNAYVAIHANDTITNQTVNIAISYTSGIAVGFKATNDASLQFDEGTGSILDFVYFERNGLVKSYALVIIIGVWLITLIFVGSVAKVTFGYKQPKEALAIPIATLFAITSLRGSMPGAPAGFGAVIDFVGILPCLAIITLTGVFLFGYLVLSNSEITATEPLIEIPKFRKRGSTASTGLATAEHSAV